MDLGAASWSRKRRDSFNHGHRHQREEGPGREAGREDEKARWHGRRRFGDARQARTRKRGEAARPSIKSFLSHEESEVGGGGAGGVSIVASSPRKVRRRTTAANRGGRSAARLVARRVQVAGG